MIDNIKNKNQVDVSIIIPCKNEGDNVKLTVDSIMNSKNSLTFEILVIDDGSSDESTLFLKNDYNKYIYRDVILIQTKGLGCAGARNIGGEAANGRYLFFCDAHIKVENKWLDKLVNTLKSSDADLVTPCICDMWNDSSVGYGVTWDSNLQFTWLLTKPKEITYIPLAGAATLGITKKAFQKITGFNKLFKVYGMEDQELCFKAWLYGYKLVINPDVRVKHLFRKKHPYKVTKDNIIYNTLCLGYCHFNIQRLTKLINILKTKSFFPLAAEEIKLNLDVILNEREKYFKERIYEEDFFFEKFNIQF